MAKYLYEITYGHQGEVYTMKTFAPDEETAIKQVTKECVKGAIILKAKQVSSNPAKSGTPKIY